MPRLHRCCTTGHTAFNKTTDSLYVQMYFSPSFTRACKARVRFSERSFPPGYGSDSCTVFVTVLLPTQRPGHALCTTSILYTINITVPIKCVFDVSIFGPVHFFLTPPPYISPDFCHCVLHPRHTCVAPRWGGGVANGSISRLLQTWQYHSYLCTVEGWRCSICVT